MTLVRKTISFTEQQNAWIKAQIVGGDFANDSEYIRNLIRRDQQDNEKFQALKMAIKAGLDSGTSSRNIKEIMVEVEDQLRADGTLPPN